jgi:hypothetical protein
MGYGGLAGFPLEYGGETIDEEVYGVLRNAVGIGGSARDDQGIDGLWRQCKAQAIASLLTTGERAALQVFPQIATDHLPVYEEELGLVPGEGATDEERRADVVAAWTRRLRADVPSLRQQIQLVDARADVLDVPRASSVVVVMGKAFEPQDGTPDYGPRLSTAYPAYASEFLTPVTLAVAGGIPSAADLLVMARLKRVLRDVLSSWQDFSVSVSPTGGVGFFLDLSQLDLTAMT